MNFVSFVVRFNHKEHKEFTKDTECPPLDHVMPNLPLSRRIIVRTILSLLPLSEGFAGIDRELQLLEEELKVEQIEARVGDVVLTKAVDF